MGGAQKCSVLAVLACFLLFCRLGFTGPKAPQVQKKKPGKAPKVLKKEEATPKVNVELSKKQRVAMLAVILRQARSAHSRSDWKELDTLIFQARKLSPGFVTPDWLKPNSSPWVGKELVFIREEIMANIAAWPKGKNITALEKYVLAHPQDKEARELLLKVAVKAGATQSIRNVKKVWPSAESRNPGFWRWVVILKWLAVIATTLALVYQIYSLGRDLRG